jgi:SAM-dependent methyltransferase
VRKPYDSFAAAYGAAGFSRFGKEVGEKLADKWALNLPMGSWIVDLGAGDGTAGRILRRKGFRIVSVDLSMGMLLQNTGLRVQADIRKPPLRPVFQAALCLYDAVNHIPRFDLEAFFVATAALLLPGGRFAFDANTLAGTRMWTEETCVIRKPGTTLEVSTLFDAETGHMRNRVTGWVSGGLRKKHIEETIDEWYHPIEPLETTVEKAGFRIVSRSPLFMDGEHPEEPSKWFYEAEVR